MLLFVAAAVVVGLVVAVVVGVVLFPHTYYDVSGLDTPHPPPVTYIARGGVDWLIG